MVTAGDKGARKAGCSHASGKPVALEIFQQNGEKRISTRLSGRNCI
jgi:hypothetical protein